MRPKVDLIASAREHLILLAPSSAALGSRSDRVRLIQPGDAFRGDYLCRLAEGFLAEGERGIGYHWAGEIIGFLWIRRGGGIEGVGDCEVCVPDEYAVLHHFVLHEDFRGRGIGGELLRHWRDALDGQDQRRVIAFVAGDNLPSLHAFAGAGFRPRGRLVAQRILGFTRCRLLAPDLRVKLHTRPRLHRAFADFVHVPLRVVAAPGKRMARECVARGVFGDVRWHRLLAATVLRYSLPAILRVPLSSGRQVILPCTVSPGRLPWAVRLDVEPTGYQPWPHTEGVSPADVISAIVSVCQSRWIESLEWTLPFSVSDECEKIVADDRRTWEVTGTWILELDEPYDAVNRSKFNATTRWQIRKAAERGVEVIDRPTDEQIRSFQKLWAQAYRSQGWSGLYLSEQFFLGLKRTFGEKARFVLGRVGGQVAAGALFLDEEAGSVYYCAAADRRYKDFFAVDAILAHEIRSLCHSGKKYLNFGGIGSSRSLATFKERWGAKPTVLYRLKWTRDVSKITGIRSLATLVATPIVGMYLRLMRRRVERAVRVEIGIVRGRASNGPPCYSKVDL